MRFIKHQKFVSIDLSINQNVIFLLFAHCYLKPKLISEKFETIFVKQFLPQSNAVKQSDAKNVPSQPYLKIGPKYISVHSAHTNNMQMSTFFRNLWPET